MDRSKPNGRPREQLKVRIAPELMRWLERVAARRDASVSFTVEQLLEAARQNVEPRPPVNVTAVTLSG